MNSGLQILQPEQAHITYRNQYTPYPYYVHSLHLMVRIADGRANVKSEAVYEAKGPIVPLVLQGQNQRVHDIRLDGETLPSPAYQLGAKTFTLLEPPVGPFTLSFETEIHPDANLSCEGLYRTNGLYCTQCEAEGFRKITFFPDRPDVLTIYTVRIEASATDCPILLSNGVCTETGLLEGGYHFATWHDPYPKPCYLFALVAGALQERIDYFTTSEGRKVTLKILADGAYIDQLEFAMQALKTAMRWDEDVYGRVYDLDVFHIVGVADFNIGGMENKSLNIFNTIRLLTRPDLSTDDDYIAILRIIGHEYFHNWSGNRVTCRDWFQLSLKEGFTVLREAQFAEHILDADVERIKDVTLLRAQQFAEDAGPLSHAVRPDQYIEINNFFTLTIYEKGAEVIRMLVNMLGEKLFRQGTDLYFSRHDGQATTCDAFIKCMEDVSGRDLTHFMRWYNQAGTPQITVHDSYDASTHSYKITLMQTTRPTPGQPEKLPLVVPVACALYNAQGADITPPEQRTLILTKPQETFTFNNIPARPVPSLLRGFSAPVTCATSLSDADYIHLMTHETDGFSQWDAAQTLMMRVFKRGLVAHGSGSLVPPEDNVISALANLVPKLAHTRPALLARILTLPDDNRVALDNAPINPAAIYAVRQQLEGAIATRLHHDYRKLCASLCDIDDMLADPLDSTAIGRRALKGRILGTMCKFDATYAVPLAEALYNAVSNMTDRISALSAVAPLTAPSRDALFDDFYKRFEGFENVRDKWFSLQARTMRPSILADIHALTAHPAFNLKNPNRVRALIGSFALHNMPGFHQTDGSAYVLLADAVLALNNQNPQMAASLLTAFRNWRDFIPALQSLMHAQLERIAQSGPLSDDVYEVVTKCLKAN